MPPAAVAVVSLATTAIGTAVSVYAQKKQREQIRAQAKNQQMEANLRAGQSAINDRAKARAARLNAKQAGDEAQLKATLQRKKGNAKQASMMAQMSRQGLNLGSESFDDVLASDAMDNELQTTFALYDGAKAQEGSLYQAEGFETQAKVTRRFGDLKISNIEQRKNNQITASRISTVGTVIGGIGEGVGSFGDFQAAGIF